MRDEMKEKKDFYIRNWAKGNPGNIMMIYLTALKMQQTLGFGKIVNVDIPIFNINISELPKNLIGLHDRRGTNNKQFNYVPMRGLKHAVQQDKADFISLEGFCQHLDNFPDFKSLDYDKIFPCLLSAEGGKEDELVISIRGGEILAGIHPHYCLIPPEFYEFIIHKTQKKPIFYGQLDDSPYMKEIKERFPFATYIKSRGVAEDFDYLRKSKHIIISSSTFSWMAAWLSKATKVYFPIIGMFNPFQHQSMLLPFNDERYEFYLFPISFSTHVDHYQQYLDPIRTSWEFIDHHTLYKRIPKANYMIDDCMCALDPLYYIESFKDKQEYGNLKKTWEVFSSIGIYNHYMEYGFFMDDMDYKVCSLNDQYYIKKYPFVAQEIVQGSYKNIMDHYLRRGQYLGLSIKPS